jgi:hypothetical protein
MFTARSTRILGFLLVISWGMVGISHARIITSYQFDFVLPIHVDTPFPNNDNAILNNPNKVKLPNLSYMAIEPFDIVFTVQPSSGTTEYFFSKMVTNTTGIAWVGYNFELGFGVGDTFYRFDEKPIPFSIGLPDFDTPERDPTPTSSVFSTLSTHERIDIQWSGGIVPPGGTMDFTFSIDTPDDWTDHDIYSDFTLRQTPEPIPAPPALILGGLGTSLTLMLKRRIL